MAVPGLLDGWRGSGEPLRPADVRWSKLRSLWDASEQSVFEAAFAPDADAPRQLAEPRSAAFERSDEAAIADSAWED